MKQCIECGFSLEDDAKFCSECGSRQPEAKRFCTECGAEIPAGAKFCIECGTPAGGGQSNQSNQSNQSSQDNQNSHSSQNSQSSESNQSNQGAPSLATMIGEDVEVSLPDEETISLTIKGIPFNMKFVEGEKFTDHDEIYDFFIGETAVTQALWMTVMGSNPSTENDDLEAPVNNLTKQDITAFFIKLQKLTGVKFTLPTYEQKRFASKGGVKSKGYEYAGSNVKEEVGWFDKHLHPVAQLYPNELGLYDMSGEPGSLLLSWYQSNNGETEKYTIRLVIDLNQPELQPDNLLNASLLLRQDALKAKRDDSLRRKEAVKQKKLDKCKTDEQRRYVELSYSRGPYFYSPREHPEKYLWLIFGKEYEEFLKKEQELKERVDKALKSGELEWKKYVDSHWSRIWTRSFDKIKIALMDNGATLIIKGDGDMPTSEFDFDVNPVLSGYEACDNVRNLVVVGNFNLFDLPPNVPLPNLEMVVLPDSVTEIGPSALNSNDIQYINLPSSLYRISRWAFEGTDLKALFIPDSVGDIEDYAFRGNEKLHTVVLPTRLKDKVDSVFEGCDKLKIK